MKFLAMLRAAFAAVGAVVVRFVREGGRLVRRLVSIGAQPVPPAPFEIAEEALMETAPAAPKVGDEMEAIRQLAASLAAGSVRPEQVEKVPSNAVEWLRVMPRSMLCRVACASDSAIDRHLHGGPGVKGVLVFDRDAVLDYARPAPRRYLRDVMGEMGLMQSA